MIHFLTPDGKDNVLSVIKFMNYGIKEMDLAFEEKRMKLAFRLVK